ncbi:MAG: YbjQ family protein [Deltaproteobacteria bacterium]|nr:YbjQ family protein [Deltaproteobacteria bacterium]
MTSLLLSTMETVPGHVIRKHLGLVQGSSVRSKHFGRDLMASLKNMVGGELKGYTELLQETRDEALERMQAEAVSIGANAVLNVRLATSSVATGAAEVFAYGTAVVLEALPATV